MLELTGLVSTSKSSLRSKSANNSLIYNMNSILNIFALPCARRCLLFVAALFCCASTAFSQEQEQVQPKQASPYPVVVLESNASFSISNAPAQPAANLRATVPAQPFLPKEIYQRTAQPVLDATDLIAEGFNKSVVEIHGEDGRIAIGTVVSTRGHILTKLSLVEDIDERKVRFHANDFVWTGTLVAFDKTDDLALYSLHTGKTVPSNALRPVTFSTPGRLRNGKLVISIGAQSKSLGIGMTTAPPTERAIDKDCESCIDMGLTLDATMNLTRVYPRTVGESLGLLVGDRLLAINRNQVSTAAAFDEFEKKVQAGDLISITYMRNGQAFEVTDKVPAITKVSKSDRWGGGPFSKRRNGFSSVLVHDSVIEPHDCGGPLVTLQGQFCGINIARSMRVASLAIPADSVQQFLLRYVVKADLIIEN